MTVLLSLLLVLLAALLLAQKKRHKRELQTLSDYLLLVQDRREVPPISDQAEGESQVLRSEIYKVASLLQRQFEEEARRNHHMAEMLANISHQLKTPLTSLTLLCDLLQEPDLSPEDRTVCLTKMTGQLERMTWLIKLILTTAQIDAQVINFKPQKVNWQDLLVGVFKELEPLALKRQVRLISHVDQKAHLVCDPNWTQEAISNVVKNALEHSPADSQVDLTVTTTALYSDLIIKDQGTGIAPEDLPHIFDRFYKGQTAKPETVGIGLALAKQIITRQQGHITASSQLGQGSQFHIRFYKKT